jgi:adenylate kinase family enzyme
VEIPPPADLSAIRRILVYGVTGSGKTTYAAGLAGTTGLPWHEADALTWEPGWVSVPVEEQRRRIAAIAAAERWILDTAYGHWRDLVVPRAELVVALDYSRALTFARLLRRTIVRSIDKKPICNGNVESLAHAFTRDSILWWHVTSFGRKRARIAQWCEDPLGPAVVRFRRPGDARRWLDALAACACS